MPLDSRENKKRKRLVGFSCAINGLKDVVSKEINFKIHLVVALLIVVSSFLLHLKPVEWVLVLLTMGSVLSFEMINTAVERAMDYLAPEIHPLVGLVKDISAGAVLIAAINAVIIGIIVFLPKVLDLFV